MLAWRLANCGSMLTTKILAIMLKIADPRCIVLSSQVLMLSKTVFVKSKESVKSANCDGTIQ